MTGGGFGGAAIALVPSDGISRIQVAIDGAFARARLRTADDVHGDRLEWGGAD